MKVLFGEIKMRIEIIEKVTKLICQKFIPAVERLLSKSWGSVMKDDQLGLIVDQFKKHMGDLFRISKAK